MNDTVQVRITASFNVTEDSLAGGCPLGLGEYSAGLVLALPEDEAEWCVVNRLGYIEE